MSQTYLATAVMILAQLLPLVGIQVGSAELTTTLQTLITLGSGVWVLYRRYQAGGVNILGKRV